MKKSSIVHDVSLPPHSQLPGDGAGGGQSHRPRGHIGDPSDRLLYTNAVSGDRSAVRDLVVRYHPQLVAYAAANGWSRSDCEDAVQLAWMRFFQHVQRAGQDPTKALRKPESIRFWLMTTTLNALRQEHRTSRRQETLVDRATSEAAARSQLFDEPDYLAPIHLEERVSEVRVAFARLTEQCRELISLLLMDPPLSYQQISDLSGRPRGSIGPTRQRCIEQLRTLIDGGDHE